MEYPKFQAVVDAAFEKWGEAESFESFVAKLESKERDLVALGVLNQQVENGGFSQWGINGYSVGAPYAHELLVRLGTPEALEMASIVDEALVALALQEDEDEEARLLHVVGGSRQDELDDLDSQFYKINDAVMAQVEASLCVANKVVIDIRLEVACAPGWDVEVLEVVDNILDNGVVQSLINDYEPDGFVSYECPTCKGYGALSANTRDEEECPGCFGAGRAVFAHVVQAERLRPTSGATDTVKVEAGPAASEGTLGISAPRVPTNAGVSQLPVAQLPVAHYVKGDAAEYTGAEKALHGRTAYEVKIIEGCHTGETAWTYIPPTARGAERNPARWTS